MEKPTTRALRLTVLTRALQEVWRPRGYAGEAAGATALAAAALVDVLDRAPFGTPGRLAGGALLFTAAATAAKAGLLRGDVRAAHEAFSWIGRWEWLRARREVADPFPATPGTMRAHVEAHEPFPHPAWVELLVFVDEPERARELAERLPEGTPWERFEREATLSYLGWADTAQNDDAAARRALAAVSHPEERLRAEAQLALGEARDALGHGREDWMAPLVRLRERLGEHADGILRHEWWRAQVLVTVPYAVFASVSVEALTRFA